jgi:hypothetical protein
MRTAAKVLIDCSDSIRHNPLAAGIMKHICVMKQTYPPR